MGPHGSISLATMRFSIRTIRIIGASLAAVMLIGGAYLISGPNPFGNTAANAASTDELLKAYAAKDSDMDALPDWQEALYGTDPNNAHSVDVSLTDAQAVQKGLVKPKFSSAAVPGVGSTTSSSIRAAAPDTLTDQFARSLFTQFVQQSNGTEPTPDEIAQFMQAAVADLTANHRIPDAYALTDVTISGTGAVSLRAYLTAAERVFAANSVPAAQDPLGYLSDGMMNNDTTAFKKLSSISTAYAAIAKALIKVPVPKEAAYAHLELVNALMHMSEVAGDMAVLQTDPLRTTLGISLYPSTATGFARGFADLYKVLQAEGVQIGAGEPGGDFYASCRMAAAS